MAMQTKTSIKFLPILAIFLAHRVPLHLITKTFAGSVTDEGPHSAISSSLQAIHACP
jgi:hypothetical protein